MPADDGERIDELEGQVSDLESRIRALESNVGDFPTRSRSLLKRMRDLEDEFKKEVADLERKIRRK